jgi:phage shock protein C
MVDGVCGGIAEYFEIDPVLVRIVWVLFTIFGGMGLIAYILAMIVIPRKPLESETEASAQPAPPPPPPKEKPVRSEPEHAGKGSLAIGIILVAIGAIFLVDNLSFFRGFYVWGWFRRHFWDFIIPGLFIVAGIALLVRSSDKQNGNA